MKRLMIACVLSLLPTLAQAQTIEKWTLKVYQVGAAAPLQAPTDLLAANVTCNQTPPSATASTVNPTKVVFDDPNVSGKVCIWTDPGTGPLGSLPFGALTYEATLTASNTAGASPESARASFTRPGLPPSVPTGIRLVK